MQDLKNLAKIVTSRRVSTLPLLGLDKTQGRSREEELAHLLTSEPNLTGLQASKLLYGDTSARSRTAVRKLKQRLQHKLLNHLFFLDHTDPRHPVYRRHEQQCLDLLHQAGILWREGEQKVLPQLLRKALRLALSGEFTQHAVSALQLLRNFYVYINDAKSYRTATKQLEELSKLLSTEQEVERLYWTAKMDLMGSVRSRRQLLKYLPEVVQQAEEAYRKTKSFNVYDSWLKLQMMQQELAGNFEEIIRITTTAERAFAQGKLNRKRFDSRFTKYYSLYAHLRARRLEEGLGLAEEYLKAFSRSTVNWFSLLENYLLLAMHSGRYALAGDLLRRAQHNPFNAKLARPAEQRWELMRAYLYFVRPEETGIRPLQFAQLVQSIPDHSRDKRGYNVAILILQFLYYLRQGNAEALLARLEGLRKYEIAHLRDPSTIRSRTFFKLLQLTVKENYDEATCRAKGQVLLERLQQTPPPGEAYAEIEIVPYENLWELTLALLKQAKIAPAA